MITTPNTPAKNIFLSIAAGMIICSFSACAKKTAATGNTANSTSTTSPVAATGAAAMPENKGQVQITRDVNSNYVIRINLKNLEEFNKLETGSTKNYIVWMDADQQKTKNLGEISSNAGFLADRSKASFEALSVYKPSKIFITEELNANAGIPGKNVIWSTSSF